MLRKPLVYVGAYTPARARSAARMVAKGSVKEKVPNLQAHLRPHWNLSRESSVMKPEGQGMESAKDRQ